MIIFEYLVFWLMGPTASYLMGGALLTIPCYLLYKLPASQKVKSN